MRPVAGSGVFFLKQFLKSCIYDSERSLEFTKTHYSSISLVFVVLFFTSDGRISHRPKLINSLGAKTGPPLPRRRRRRYPIQQLRLSFARSNDVENNGGWDGGRFYCKMQQGLPPGGHRSIHVRSCPPGKYPTPAKKEEAIRPNTTTIPRKGSK